MSNNNNKPHDIFDKEPISWTIEEVGIWLQSLNFAEYRAKFIENFISGFELLELSEEDLISIGVAKLGHRKRLLKNISTLNGNIGSLNDFDVRSFDSESDSDLSSRGSHTSRDSLSSLEGAESTNASNRYIAKCKYKNDIRMLTLKKSYSLRRVKSKIRELYGRRLEIKVRDNDGDLINVKTDKDLKTAVETFANPIRFELSRRRRKGKEEVDVLPEAETALLDNLLGSCVIIGDDCYIKYFNAAAEKLFGYSKAEVLGKNCNILMPETYAAMHDVFIANYLKTGRSKIINKSRMVVGKHKNGQELSIEISLTETKTASRHTFTAVFKHMEENQNNKNSNSIKEQYKTFEVLVDPVVVIDDQGIILYANDAANKFFGYAEELIGENVSLLMPSPHKENHNHYIQNYINTGKTTTIGKNRPLICECSDGSIKPITLTVSEDINPKTNTRNFVGIFRDRQPVAVSSRPKAFLQIEREIVNNLVVASVIIDQHGIIQAFNKTAQHLFGYDLADILGQNVKVLVGEDVHFEKHDKYIADYISTGISKVIGAERIVKCRTADTKIFSAKLTVVSKKDPVSGQYYFTGMFHNL